MEVGSGITITLCGSSLFKPVFEQVIERLSRHGCLVMGLDGYSKYDNTQLTPIQRLALRDIHRHKISQSDYIIVIDVYGYVGFDTDDEIVFAHNIGKKVYYLSEMSGYDECLKVLDDEKPDYLAYLKMLGGEK